MNTTLSCRELNKLTRTSLTDTKQLKLFSWKSQWVGVSVQRCPRDGQQINDQRTEFTELSFVDCSSSSQFYLTETCVKHLLDGSVTYNAD